MSTNEEELGEEIKVNSVAQSRTEIWKEEKKKSETDFVPIAVNLRKDEKKSDTEVVPKSIKEKRKEASDPKPVPVKREEIVLEARINQAIEPIHVNENVPVSTVSQGLMSDTTQIEKESQIKSSPSTSIQRECINKIDVKRRGEESRTVCKINHTDNLNAEVKIVPFKWIVDNKEKMFVQISNTLPISIELKRKENLASVNNFQVWDPGKEVNGSVEAYTELNLSTVIFRGKDSIPTAKGFHIWDPGI